MRGARSRGGWVARVVGMPRPLGKPKETHGKDWVALTLAIGIATAVNCITFAVLYDAIMSEGPGLSENATQILVAAFGGIIGVLGSYIGYRAGSIDQSKQEVDRGGPSELPSSPDETRPIE